MAGRGIHVGTSGWTYDDWTGPFYPPDVKGAERLAYYAGRFDTVEVNATFYRLPTRTMIDAWNRRLSEGFHLVLKGSRAVTHYRKLRDCDEPLAAFLDRAGQLGRLKVILWQLPPSLHKDVALLEGFVAELPPEGRYAFEFRHSSWECHEVFGLLERVGMTHVVVSRVSYPFAEVHTAPLAYYRLHGPDKLCGSPYDEPWLAALAERIARLAEDGVTSFTFLNNDIDGHAVRNADTLNRHLERLGVPAWGAGGQPSRTGQQKLL